MHHMETNPMKEHMTVPELIARQRYLLEMLEVRVKNNEYTNAIDFAKALQGCSYTLFNTLRTIDTLRATVAGILK